MKVKRRGKGRSREPVVKRGKHHFCPFPQCSRALQKLSQHIKVHHPDVSTQKRLALAHKAKPVVPEQILIQTFFGGLEEEEKGEEVLGQESEEEEVQREDLANEGDDSVTTEEEDAVVDCFCSDEEFLVKLKQHLTSIHGRKRIEKEAKQICQEVNRYLIFAHPEALDHHQLLDGSRMDAYLTSLEASVRPSTVSAKVCRLRQGLEFLSLSLEPTDHQKAQQVSSAVLGNCNNN